jgi:hypothetical protein
MAGSMQATPRKADYAWTTLARVLSVAKDNGRIPIMRGKMVSMIACV